MPVGTVARPKECPLLGSRVAVKELGRQVDVRPSQIEVGNVKVSSVAHDPEILPMLLSQSKALTIGKIAERRTSAARSAVQSLRGVRSCCTYRATPARRIANPAVPARREN